jgi:hypothetical protein
VVRRGGAAGSTTSASRLMVDLTASRAVTAGTYELEVTVGTEKITVPVSVSVMNSFMEAKRPQTSGIAAAPTTPPPVLISTQDLFAGPINGLLMGTKLDFNACGGEAAERNFSVAIPKAGYVATGPVARLEYAASVGERAEFLRTHSLNPTLVFNPSHLASLSQNAHPSPFPHSIVAVRMCLEPVLVVGGWTFKTATDGGASPEVVISVTFNKAVFRTRGMPADPTGAITGVSTNLVRWGHPIADTELPDVEYQNPRFDVRLTLTIGNGKVGYGPVQVGFGTAPKLTGVYLGPSSIEGRFKGHATSGMEQIRQEIRKAFEAPGTRNAITAAIMAVIAARGVTEVAALDLSKGDAWQVTR